VEYRVATEQDHEAIVLVTKLSPYTKDFSNQMMFSSAVSYAKGWMRVAVSRGEIVGFTCRREKSRVNRTKLYFLGVREDHKRRGIGRALVDDMQQRLPPAKATIELSCALGNEAARLLYLGLGFRIVEQDETYHYMVRDQ
jgi:ribosomal protein S18 acetylase RimI-like enzyme